MECEVRTWKCHVYLVLSRSFAMKVSSENNNSRVIRIFMMKNKLEHVSQLRNRQCRPEDGTQMYRQRYLRK